MLAKFLFRAIYTWLVKYWYIPVGWIFRQASKQKAPLDISKLEARRGHVVILTGATGALGAVLLKRLFQLEMHVVLGIRDFEKMEKVMIEIRDEEGLTTGSSEMLSLDFSSLASVRKFAAEVLDRGMPVRMIINAAGQMPVPFALTADGNASQFQVNHLGPLLLMNLLIPKMRQVAIEAGRPGKIVNVSSAVQYYGKIDFDNLNGEKSYNATQMLYNSKLAQCICTHFLGLKLKQQGVHVHVNSVHPGFLRRKAWHNILLKIGPIQKIADKFLTAPDIGVDDVLYVAFDPATESSTGNFYVNREPDPSVPKVAWTVMEKLWAESCALAKLETNVLAGKMPDLDLDLEDLDSPLPLLRQHQRRESIHPSVTVISNSENPNKGFKSSAVAPLEGPKRGSLGILASSVPIGIFTSSVAPGMFEQ